MISLQEKLLEIGQKVGSYKRSETGLIKLDYSKLPNMTPTPDWNISATDQWSTEELTYMHQADMPSVIDWIAPGDPWIYMGAVAEFILHGEEDKARDLARALVSRNQNAREDAFEYYFGVEMTHDLLTSPQPIQ